MDISILVVDDNKDVLDTISTYLIMNKYTVKRASSGGEALSIIRNEKVHIVISDVKMPKMDGIELLREIRKFDFTIQVIMMTGYSTLRITMESIECGATDYILKPFENISEIKDLVDASIVKLQRWEKILAKSAKSTVTQRRKHEPLGM